MGVTKSLIGGNRPGREQDGEQEESFLEAHASTHWRSCMCVIEGYEKIDE